MKKLLFILILFCSIQGFGQIKLFLPLNGNASDASGNGNNGTVSGAVSNTGRTDGGYLFDTTSDVITCASTTCDFEKTDAFSIGCWIKYGTIANGNYQYLITKTIFVSGQGWRGYRLTSYSRGTSVQFMLTIQTSDTGVKSIYTPSPYIPITVGKWYYVVATYDGSGNISGEKIFINGIQVATTNDANQAFGATIKNTGEFKVANATGALNVYAPLNGVFDDPFGALGAWSPAEIKNKYAAGVGHF